MYFCHYLLSLCTFYGRLALLCSTLHLCIHACAHTLALPYIHTLLLPHTTCIYSLLSLNFGTVSCLFLYSCICIPSPSLPVHTLPTVFYVNMHYYTRFGHTLTHYTRLSMSRHRRKGHCTTAFCLPVSLYLSASLFSPLSGWTCMPLLPYLCTHCPSAYYSLLLMGILHAPSPPSLLSPPASHCLPVPHTPTYAFLPHYLCTHYLLSCLWRDTPWHFSLSCFCWCLPSFLLPHYHNSILPHPLFSHTTSLPIPSELWALHNLPVSLTPMYTICLPFFSSLLLYGGELPLSTISPYLLSLSPIFLMEEVEKEEENNFLCLHASPLSHLPFPLLYLLV